jgi:hypothetical protein
MSTAIDAVTAFPRFAAAVTPSDVTVFDSPNMIFVGGPGPVTVMPWGGGPAVQFLMQAGGYVPVQVRQVMATGTSATSLVRVF